MSSYPFEKLQQLAKALSDALPDQTFQAQGASKSFLESYDCGALRVGNRAIWISEKCLTDQDDGSETVGNATKALLKLDVARHLLADPFLREVLLTHREDSTPGHPAKVLDSWNGWNLVDPNPSTRVSSG